MLQVVYGVEYIEIEFGRRPWGWRLYTSKDQCITRTQEDSNEGQGNGQYLGPVRPLYYVEIPIDSLSSEQKAALKRGEGRCDTHNEWQPEFTGKPVKI